MPVPEMINALQQMKKELWKGIPMSKDSEKKYQGFIKMCKSTDTSNIPRGGGFWDMRLGLSQSGKSLKDMRMELERCAERDRKSGEKCGIVCQMRKRKR